MESTALELLACKGLQLPSGFAAVFCWALPGTGFCTLPAHWNKTCKAVDGKWSDKGLYHPRLPRESWQGKSSGAVPVAQSIWWSSQPMLEGSCLFLVSFFFVPVQIHFKSECVAQILELSSLIISICNFIMCILLRYAHYGELSIETKEHLPIWIVVVSVARVQEPIKKKKRHEEKILRLATFPFC